MDGTMSSNMPKTVASVVVAISFIIAIPLQFITIARANTPTPVLVRYGLHIAELQTRSEADSSSEYLVLYNETEESIDISDWRLEYKPGLGGNWDSKLLSTQPNDSLFIVESKGFFTLVSNNYIDAFPDADFDAKIAAGSAESHGHIRLSVPNDEQEDSWWVVDQVGWGDTADSALGQPAPAAERGNVLQRLFTDSGEIQNTYDNALDFQVLPVDSPISQVSDTGDIDEEADDEELESGEDNDSSREEVDNEDESSSESTDDSQEDDQQQNDDSDEAEEDDQEQETDDIEESVDELYCEGIVFSELLPNPQGPRSEYPRQENAFIELHNPTNETIPLQGCGLQVDGKDTIHWFEEGVLGPEDYRAWHGIDSDLQLPVAPSGTVYLLNEANQELESVTYPAEMPEAASWSWFGDDNWRKTFDATPEEHNQELALRPCPEEGQERNPETNRCRSIEIDTLTPCIEGQERNPETNRCRSINSSRAQFVPCDSGEERNPETNRCRSIDTGSNFVPCGPNRERNPETNRCRTIGSQQRQLVPCDDHQERNPDTNRCRNITSASSDLVPCEPHQERNPETNRCRNTAIPNSDVMGVQDIAVPTVEDDSNWTLALAMMSFAVGYGIWEWRHDIRNWRIRRRQSSA